MNERFSRAGNSRTTVTLPQTPSDHILPFALEDGSHASTQQKEVACLEGHAEHNAVLIFDGFALPVF